MKYLACALSLVLLLLSGAARAAGTEPDVLVRENSEKILARMRTHKEVYEKDKKKLYAMVDELVLPHFDFRKMAQLVLAQGWRPASEDQRARFTAEFRGLLVRTYSTALLKYTDEKMIYLPYKGPIDERTATVKVEVKQAAGGPNIPLEYYFYLKDQDAPWRVYDVKIDGISLVTNYRSTYAEKVRGEGLDALIASLVQDNKAGKIDKPLNAPPAANAKPKAGV
jgi:phospholipid transport system substrate-binding protein